MVINQYNEHEVKTFKLGQNVIEMFPSKLGISFLLIACNHSSQVTRF